MTDETRTPPPDSGRDAGLEEAARAVEALNGLIWARVAAREIRALKSTPPAPIEPGEREWMLDVRPQLAHPSKGPEPSLRELVRRYYGEHFANTRANELCAQYLAALTPPTEPVVDDGEGKR